MLTIGQPLVVDAAGVHGFLRVHAEVDDAQDGHQHGVDDGAAAGEPVTMKSCRPLAMVGAMLDKYLLRAAAFGFVPMLPRCRSSGAELKSPICC
jgi:hypothetical protein